MVSLWRCCVADTFVGQFRRVDRPTAMQQRGPMTSAIDDVSGCVRPCPTLGSSLIWFTAGHRSSSTTPWRHILTSPTLGDVETTWHRVSILHFHVSFRVGRVSITVTMPLRRRPS